MENELLSKLLEELAAGMAMGERAILEEAARRLRIDGGRSGDRVVMLAQKLTEVRRLSEHVVQENAELKAKLEQLHRDVTLHVQYDLEEEGCGAVLQEGTDKYYISALALAELLEARRDGRLVVLDKEESK